MSLQVKKRTGEVSSFNIEKIKGAIQKAFEAVQKVSTEDIIELLSLRVCANFSSKIIDNVICIEDIQDSVEVVLIQTGYVDVSKAYILYRKQHEKLRNMKSTILDYKSTVDN